MRNMPSRVWTINSEHGDVLEEGCSHNRARDDSGVMIVTGNQVGYWEEMSGLPLNLIHVRAVSHMTCRRITAAGTDKRPIYITVACRIP